MRREKSRHTLQCQAAGNVVLEVKDLHARVSGEERQILQGVNLIIKEGEVRTPITSTSERISNLKSWGRVMFEIFSQI